MTKYEPFHAADHLDNPVVIAEFLTAAFESGDMRVFLRALEEVAKARGVVKVAKLAGIGRESVYKSLVGKNPRFDTVSKILRGVGVVLAFGPLHASPTSARMGIAKSAAAIKRKPAKKRAVKAR